MDVWRVSINHCQFGPTPLCTPIISSQCSKVGCSSPPHPFSQPFILESCLSDLSDKLQQNCPVCKKNEDTCFQSGLSTFSYWKLMGVSFIRGLEQTDVLRLDCFALRLNIAIKLPQSVHTLVSVHWLLNTAQNDGDAQRLDYFRYSLLDYLSNVM